MAYTFRVWDKASPINGCPADVALKSLEITENDKLIIISKDGADTFTQKVAVTLSDADTAKTAQEYVDQFTAGDKAAAEAAAQPSFEDRLKALEAAQLSALGLGV